MITLYEVSRLTGKLSSLWPNFKLTPGLTNQAFFEALTTLEANSLEAHRAVALLLSSNETYYPAPSAQDVVRAIIELRKHSGKKKPTPEEGWAKLCECARQGWTWEKVKSKLSEKAQSAIKSIGGWDRIKYAPTEELPFIRKDFIAAFGNMEARDEKLQTLEYANSPQVAALIEATSKQLNNTEKKRI